MDGNELLSQTVTVMEDTLLNKRANLNEKTSK